MTVLLERRRLIVSPGLAPTQLRREDIFGHPKHADVDLTIGLINNMPDAALQATERQFMRLLRQAAGNVRIDFHCFSLPERLSATKLCARSPRYSTNSTGCK